MANFSLSPSQPTTDEDSEDNATTPAVRFVPRAAMMNRPHMSRTMSSPNISLKIVHQKFDDRLKMRKDALRMNMQRMHSMRIPTSNLSSSDGDKINKEEKAAPKKVRSKSVGPSRSSPDSEQSRKMSQQLSGKSPRPTKQKLKLGTPPPPPPGQKFANKSSSSNNSSKSKSSSRSKSVPAVPRKQPEKNSLPSSEDAATKPKRIIGSIQQQEQIETPRSRKHKLRVKQGLVPSPPPPPPIDGDNTSPKPSTKPKTPTKTSTNKTSIKTSTTKASEPLAKGSEARTKVKRTTSKDEPSKPRVKRTTSGDGAKPTNSDVILLPPSDSAAEKQRVGKTSSTARTTRKSLSNESPSSFSTPRQERKRERGTRPAEPTTTRQASSRAISTSRNSSGKSEDRATVTADGTKVRGRRARGSSVDGERTADASSTMKTTKTTRGMTKKSTSLENSSKPEIVAAAAAAKTTSSKTTIKPELPERSKTTNSLPVLSDAGPAASPVPTDSRSSKAQKAKAVFGSMRNLMKSPKRATKPKLEGPEDFVTDIM